MTLANLLERAELFVVTQEIRDQLVLALGDLVTLVASVSSHFHKAVREMNRKRIHIDIYRTFPSQIQTFRQRCEKIAIAMWRHQLLRDNVDGDRGGFIPDRRPTRKVKSNCHLQFLRFNQSGPG
jgi:hypothetical protein